jgi:hypothetical protein
MIKKKTSARSTLQFDTARMQAWVVALLTLINEAQDIGTVIGSGGPCAAAAELHGTQGELLLAVDIFSGPAAQLAVRRAVMTKYAPVEYWQIVRAPKPRVHLLQRDASGAFQPTPPDSAGLHFSLAHEELRFPVDWFSEQPKLLEMMEYLGLIDVD